MLSDALHCIIRTDTGNGSAAATKAAHQPVFLRSYKIPSPKSSHYQRVAQVLTEMGLRHDRLVMPTAENCQQLEQLLVAAGALVDTKKVVDRVDHEISVLRARLAEKEGRVIKEDADGDTEMRDAADENDAEDLDADADGETDRAVSQAPSTKSSVRKGVRPVLVLLSRHVVDVIADKTIRIGFFYRVEYNDSYQSTESKTTTIIDMPCMRYTNHHPSTSMYICNVEYDLNMFSLAV